MFPVTAATIKTLKLQTVMKRSQDFLRHHEEVIVVLVEICVLTATSVIQTHAKIPQHAQI